VIIKNIPIVRVWNNKMNTVPKTRCSIYYAPPGLTDATQQKRAIPAAHCRISIDREAMKKNFLEELWVQDLNRRERYV
jgi:hypothetical protein